MTDVGTYLSVIQNPRIPKTRRGQTTDNARGQIHGFIMSLFPECDGSPREQFGVLWSIERNADGREYILIRSNVPPSVNGGWAGSGSLFGKKPTVKTKKEVFVPFDTGATVSYRIHVNPVRVANGSRKPIRGAEAVAEWWGTKLPRIGLTPPSPESVFSVDRIDVDAIRIHRAEVGFGDAVIIGRSVVADDKVLADAVVNGVGKGKSYGTGLLLLGR